MEISRLLFAEAPLLQTAKIILYLALTSVLYVSKLVPRLDRGLDVMKLGVDKSI